MNISELRSTARLSLEGCEQEPRRLTLYFLLTLYAVCVPLELISFALDDRVRLAAGLAAIASRNRLTLITVLLAVASSVFSTLWDRGYDFFAMKILRPEEVSFRDFAEGFRMAGQVLVVLFLELLLVTLGSMLFFFPGLIAAYGCRFAVYLLFDHPEMTPTQAIASSFALTRGHKLELFLLDLTFLPHYLLLYLGEGLEPLLEILGKIRTPAQRTTFYLLGIALVIVVEYIFRPHVYVTQVCAYRKALELQGQS